MWWWITGIFIAICFGFFIGCLMAATGQGIRNEEIDQLKKVGNKQDDEVYKLSCDVIVKNEEIDNLKAINKQLSDDKALMHKKLGDEIERLKKEKEWLCEYYINNWNERFPRFDREYLEKQLKEDMQQALKEK